MIDIKFMGGLGNQMFQYALYIRLKKEYPAYHFHLDFDSYKYVDYHGGFKLDKIFNIPQTILLKDKYSIWWRLFYKIKVNLKKYWFFYIDKKRLIKDNCNLFDFHLSPDAYSFIVGTWADERCFIKAQKEVLNLFKFLPTTLSEKIKEVSCNIANSSKKIVAVHIRRGDYINSNFISLANTNYYSNSLEYIEKIENIHNLKLYIFSDDPQWCKDNLSFLNRFDYEFIQGNKDYEDMYLMSKCMYIVIANSTFSWWSAYLSNAKNVIAPQLQFIGQTTPTSYPKDWIVMSLG
ncbi:alpha-1,2-fucosyltransferase [Phocaeicola coprophilus]|uniref:alpha-1,2-fucosyltransferase n=1 Tax=Phocaeicola coprophilus TaxID=387090 RepID=UPI0022E14A62|nr:alpha-1,2-fucosyltransferase [Phocaeicola coprophilus]